MEKKTDGKQDEKLFFLKLSEILFRENYIKEFGQDPYMKAFLSNISLRSSCYECKFKSVNHKSDITLADYWGLGLKSPFNHPTFRGVSMLLVNNQKAWDFIKDNPTLFYEERTLEEAIEGNHNLSHSSERPTGRDSFIHDMQIMESKQLVEKYGIKESYRDYLRLLKQWVNSKRV